MQQLAKLRKRAMDLLARREHSKFELSQKLVAKGFEARDVAEVVANLEHEGLQSDQRFTECYVAMRRNLGFGPIRINAELHQRGIDDELIAEFLAGDEASWFEVAQKALRKKFGLNKPSDLKELAKRMRYLQYKGFTADTIKKTINN